MDKLTAIKIKYDNGTYSDEIPVSVLSENVEWDNTHTLVDVLGNIDVDVTGTIQDQISQLFNEKVSNSDMQSYVSSSMPTYITNWLNTNVNPVGSAVVVDSSFTISGAAADAKKVGDEFASVNTDISDIKERMGDFTRLQLNTFTQNGITFSKNTDGTYNVSGTATTAFQRTIATFIPEVGKTYIFESNVSNPSNDWYLFVKGVNGASIWYRTGEVFTCTTNDTITVTIYFSNGAEADATVFPYISEYPMLTAKYLDTKIDSRFNLVNDNIENFGDYQYDLSADEIGLSFENYDLSSTTEITLNNTRLTTVDKIDARNLSGVTITAPSGYRFRVVAYESNDNINPDFDFGWFAETTKNYDLMFPYIRIVLSKTNGNIASSDASVFTITFTKEITEHNEKEMSLMLDKFISKDIIPYSYGTVYIDPTSQYAYVPYQSGTFETNGVWISSMHRCVAGDSIEIVSAQESSRYILATFGANGIMNHYDVGIDVTTPCKIQYTFTENDKYFRVTCRRTMFRFAYVKYHSQYNNNRYVPDYAHAEFETVLSELQNKMLLGNPIVFGFNTDQHTSYKYKEHNVLYGLRTMKMLSNEIPFDFHCLGGDAPSYQSTQVVDILNDVNNTTKQMIGSGCPVIPIVGNHDAIDNNSAVTNAELYNVTFKRAITEKMFDYCDSVGCNAYIDSAMHSVRYIFVDSIPRTGYTLADVNAFLNTALSTLPTGYNAIILSHRKLNLNLPTEMGADGIDCAATLEAFASKIIVCVNGHSHQDGSDTINGILYVSTTTSGLDGLAQSDTRLSLLGTADETAYDVFIVDQENKKVYTIRYGYGENREWSYTLI